MDVPLARRRLPGVRPCPCGGRRNIRAALEQVTNYRGLVRYYGQRVTPERHEALDMDNVFLARYESDGAIVRLTK